MTALADRHRGLIALAVTLALTLACVAWSATIFRTGRRLKA